MAVDVKESTPSVRPELKQASDTGVFVATHPIGGTFYHPQPWTKGEQVEPECFHPNDWHRLKVSGAITPHNGIDEIVPPQTDIPASILVPGLIVVPGINAGTFTR